VNKDDDVMDRYRLLRQQWSQDGVYDAMLRGTIQYRREMLRDERCQARQPILDAFFKMKTDSYLENEPWSGLCLCITLIS
jgi:hypothetical protein